RYVGRTGLAGASREPRQGPRGDDSARGRSAGRRVRGEGHRAGVPRDRRPLSFSIRSCARPDRTKKGNFPGQLLPPSLRCPPPSPPRGGPLIQQHPPPGRRLSGPSAPTLPLVPPPPPPPRARGPPPPAVAPKAPEAPPLAAEVEKRLADEYADLAALYKHLHS